MVRRIAVLILLALPTLLLAQDTPAKKAKNRLAGETSPYLRMHAHNPTDWYPWGPEAFAKAKKENKLVFLSIGYSSCYWCHVMERESFNREDVAKILNDGFVCIKVDREERPDVDHIYMTAIQETTGGGGWPLNVFLLPDGRPITGGTYWPREDKIVNGKTVGGFVSLLKAIGKAYAEDKGDFEKGAELAASITRKALASADAFKLAVTPLDRTLVEETVDGLKVEFDPEYGGFGAPSRKFQGPKFPTTCRLQFLLSQSNNKDALAMATKTLDKMAAGGIYDHVGGGFHRYSTERTWTVPHFEKMLYDNAQLVEVYARAFALTGNPQYKRVVDQTLGYIEREMTLPGGAFSSSQDAETDHEEGRFYVWTTRELSAALLDAETLEFARNVFGADGAPNFEKTAYVLTRPQPTKSLAREMKIDEADLNAKIDALSKALYDARLKRERPFRNDVAITAWSGLMIGAYATAGETLKNKAYVNTAIAAAEHVLKNQKTKDGRLLRTFGAAPGKEAAAAGPAYLEDYAFLVHGLLNLYDATKDKKWLDESAALTDTMIRWHGEDKKGGFYLTANDHEKLFARAKDQFDGATPSGNSAAVRNLVRLAAADDRFRAEAEKHLRYFAGSMKSYGPGLTTMVEATHRYLGLNEKK